MIDWKTVKKIHRKRHPFRELERILEEIKMDNIKKLNIVLFSEKESAKILNVSYNKLRYMRESKLISYCRVGHSVKYRASDLTAFVENNSVAVGA
jgi:hypothetical protein